MGGKESIKASAAEPVYLISGFFIYSLVQCGLLVIFSKDDLIAVKAVIKWDKNIVPSEVRFTLYDISEEPGIYLNSRDNTQSHQRQVFL